MSSGKRGRIIINGVVYEGDNLRVSAINNNVSYSGGNVTIRQGAAARDEEEKPVTDLLGELRKTSNGSRQNDIIERYISAVDHVPGGIVVGAIRIVNAPSYKVDALDKLMPKTTLDVSEIVEIIAAVGTPTYQVDALRSITNYHTAKLSGLVVTRICSIIRTDTYISDAIETMRYAMDIRNRDISAILGTISAATYAVDVLKKLPITGKIDGETLTQILKAIRTDTYMADAAKYLARHVSITTGHEFAEVLNCFASDTYKADCCKALKMCTTQPLNANELIPCLKQISSSYRSDMVASIIPMLKAEGVEEIAECFDDSDFEGRKKALSVLARQFSTNSTVMALLESAKTAEAKARAEAGYSILINGNKIDIGETPLNTDLTIGLGENTVTIRRSDDNSIEVRGDQLRIEQVPFSGITNLSIYGNNVSIGGGRMTFGGGCSISGNSVSIGGGSVTYGGLGQSRIHFGNGSTSIIGVGGDLVVGAGSSCSVSTSSGVNFSQFNRNNNSDSDSEDSDTPEANVRRSPNILAWTKSQEPDNMAKKPSLLNRFSKYFGKEDKSADELPESKSESASCCVCLDAVSVGVFVPCGHKCCCMECGISLKTCPLCRIPGQFLHISHIAAGQRVYV